MLHTRSTFRVAINSDSDNDNISGLKNIKTPAKLVGRGKENAMASERRPIHTPLPAKKLFGDVATTVKNKGSKTTMSGLTPAPPKTVLRPAAGENIQKNKDPSPRPSTLRKSTRNPITQVKATPAPSTKLFVPLSDEDIGPTQLELAQEENEKAKILEEMEEEAYHESDWSDFEVEYAPPKSAQFEPKWEPLDEMPDYSKLGKGLRIASPSFDFDNGFNEPMYANDVISDIKLGGGFNENIKLNYSSEYDDDILSIKIRDRKSPLKKKPMIRKIVQRRPLSNTTNTSATTNNTNKFRPNLDDIKVEIDLDSCLLPE